MPVNIVEDLNTLTKLVCDFHSHATVSVSLLFPYHKLGTRVEVN